MKAGACRSGLLLTARLLVCSALQFSKLRAPRLTPAAAHESSGSSGSGNAEIIASAPSSVDEIPVSIKAAFRGKQTANHAATMDKGGYGGEADRKQGRNWVGGG